MYISIAENIETLDVRERESHITVSLSLIYARFIHLFFTLKLCVNKTLGVASCAGVEMINNERKYADIF